MLNTSKPPFNNRNLRLAMAKASNSKQYAKVIDLGVNAPINGLFLPSSQYYSKTSYPSYDPAGAKKLVKPKVAQQTGKPVAFTLNATQDAEVERAAEYVKQQYGNVGISVTINVLAQSALINDSLSGNLRGHYVAPVRCGRSGSQRRVVEHDHGDPGPRTQHGPQRRSPTPGRPRARASRELTTSPHQRLPNGQPTPVG